MRVSAGANLRGRLIVRQWGETEDFTFNQVMTYPIRLRGLKE